MLDPLPPDRQTGLLVTTVLALIVIGGWLGFTWWVLR